MSTSGDMLAENTSSRVSGLGVGELARGDKVVVQERLLTESSRTFEDTLVALSAAFSKVAADDLESEMVRWLDRLAADMGAEQCTIGEFNAVADAGFHVRWTVGKQPTPFLSLEDSGIGKKLARGQSISISTLDELPDEAVSTRRQLEGYARGSGYR